MKCPECKYEMKQGLTKLVFKSNHKTVVIKNLPALICKQCGEASLDIKTSKLAYDRALKKIKPQTKSLMSKFSHIKKTRSLD